MVGATRMNEDGFDVNHDVDVQAARAMADTMQAWTDAFATVSAAMSGFGANIADVAAQVNNFTREAHDKALLAESLPSEEREIYSDMIWGGRDANE